MVAKEWRNKTNKSLAWRSNFLYLLMVKYIKVHTPLKPGNFASFTTTKRGKYGRAVKIKIYGVWDGEVFTSNDHYDNTLQTMVRKKAWLTKVMPLITEDVCPTDHSFCDLLSELTNRSLAQTRELFDLCNGDHLILLDLEEKTGKFICWILSR